MMTERQYLSRAAEIEAKNPNSRAAALYRRLSQLRGESEIDELAEQYRERLDAGIGDQALMREIEMCRHGATAMNDDDASIDRIRGWVNVPLSEDGKSEARKLAKKIAKNPPQWIVSSDLSRAYETAKIISGACGQNADGKPIAPIVEVSRGFRPWNVGHFTGELSDVAVPILRNYLEHDPNEIIPDGESFCQFRDRYWGALRDASRRYPTGRLMVVAHHRNERLMFSAEAAGWPDDGSIDPDVFTEKGEKTGTCLIVEVPVQWLESR